jgi:hypothetical protein
VREKTVRGRGEVAIQPRAEAARVGAGGAVESYPQIAPSVTVGTRQITQIIKREAAGKDSLIENTLEPA